MEEEKEDKAEKLEGEECGRGGMDGHRRAMSDGTATVVSMPLVVIERIDVYATSDSDSERGGEGEVASEAGAEVEGLAHASARDSSFDRSRQEQGEAKFGEAV